MTAVVPVRLFGGADQAQVGLVDEAGGFERLPPLLLGELLRRQPAQLLVDQGQ